MTGIVLAIWLAGVAVVTSSVLGKVIDWSATKAAWPIRSTAMLGPWPVVSAEVLVIGFGMLPVAATVRLLALAGLYVAYAVAGVLLRGRPCACFGSTLATRFGWKHATLCALAAGLLAVGAAAPPPTVDTTVASVVAVVVGVAAMALAHRHRERRRRQATDPARLALVDHVVVYGSTGCPGCRGVWAQREQLTALAAYPVEFRLVGEKEAMIQAGGAIPAAIGYDPRGTPVFGPVAGLAAIQAMVSGTARDAAYR
jgi:hypothetical protein